MRGLLWAWQAMEFYSLQERGLICQPDTAPGTEAKGKLNTSTA